MQIVNVPIMKAVGKEVLVIPDMHVPNHDSAAWNAVLRYARGRDVGVVIILGDFLDVNCISGHNNGKPKLVEGERLSADYAAGRRELRRLREAVSEECLIYLIQGNHENRVTRFVEMYPQLDGLLDVPNGLGLDDLGITWVPHWDTGAIVQLGSAHFIHGQWCNKYHAFKHVDTYGVNVIYGHVHSVQLQTKAVAGKDKILLGASMGCLCNYDMGYMRGKPNNWQHAFGIMRFERSGHFYLHQQLIFNGHFIGPDGVRY